MENIFENAYFGKAYKTRDGRKVILVSMYSCEAFLIYEMPLANNRFGNSMIECRLDGINITTDVNKDVVSEWQESINEEELDKLASDYSLESHNQHSNMKIEVADGVLLRDSVAKAFIAGYHKAKQE